MIRQDVEKVLDEANFNEDQKMLFLELTSPYYGVRYTDTHVFLKLNMSRSRFYKIKKEVDTKIRRILN